MSAGAGSVLPPAAVHILLQGPSATPSPTASPSSPGGVVRRLLLHPGATEHAWWHALLTRLTTLAVVVVPVAAMVTAVAIAAGISVAVLRAVRARRAAAGARWVEIVPPEQPGAGGGLAWWRLLGPLLRSSRFALGGRRPPVALEFLAGPGGLRVGLWVSATVSADAVARTVSAAWPGSRTRVLPPPDLVEPGGRSSGGQAVLARAEWFPLGGTDLTSGADGDPLRGVLTALDDCGPGETAVLQVLARPAPGRRVARARRAAWALRSGRPMGRAARLAGALRTGPPPHPATGGTDPVLLTDVRAITGKVTDVPHFVVAVRYAVSSSSSSSSSSSGPDAGRRASGGRVGRRRRAGRLREVGAGFGLFTGPNHLVSRRLPHPDRALSSRRLSKGALVSVGELAALAHLPADPAQVGMACGSAGRIPVPVEVPYA